MKNKISIVGVLLIALLVVFVSFKASAKEGAGDNGESNNLEVKTMTGANIEVGDSESEDGVQVQVANQEQVQLQNKNGVTSTSSANVNVKKEDSSRMKNVEDQNGDSSESEDADSNDSDKEKETNQQAVQRRSDVANAVQIMLKLADKAKGGIGEEVKVIAQNQIQNHDDAEKALENVNNRSSFAKFLIGPNYSEIKNAEKILAKNQEQIKQLTELKAKLSVSADQQLLDSQIGVLENANLEITNSLSVAQKGFSLFGWFSKMFSE